MIPADVNIDSLASQIQADHVAIGEFGLHHPGLEESLTHAVTDAQNSGFGTLGVVVLDHTPTVSADMRDIAWKVQQATGLDTIIVRSPDSGAVVSDTYSRAQLEAAQYHLLGNPDFAAGTRNFASDVMGMQFPWTIVGIALIAAILFIAAATALAARKA